MNQKQRKMIEALKQVIFIVESIPDGFDLPDICNSEYEQEIFDLEWIAQKDYRLGIEVDDNGTFTYTYLAGQSGNGHGKLLSRTGLPELLRMKLEEVYQRKVTS